jgi:hypothetical protein
MCGKVSASVKNSRVGLGLEDEMKNASSLIVSGHANRKVVVAME